jgi:hypothetical protein
MALTAQDLGARGPEALKTALDQGWKVPPSLYARIRNVFDLRTQIHARHLELEILKARHGSGVKGSIRRRWDREFQQCQQRRRQLKHHLEREWQGILNYLGPYRMKHSQGK